MTLAAGDVAAFLEQVPGKSLLSPEDARPWPLRSGGAPVVVAPESVDEVQALMELAGETGVRILPSGAGCWLGAAGWAGPADVVMTTIRMDKVTHYEPADLTLRADAGLSWSDLTSRLDGHGQWLPADPPGVLGGTIGGLVASGTSGTMRGHYGATRDLVLGIDAVTGDGRKLQVGGGVVKNVAGFDLVRLLTGSRGSLGVITSVALRLFPKPPSDVTVFYVGGSEEGVEMSRAVATAPMPIAAVELLSPAEGLLAIRVLGPKAEVDDTRTRLDALLGTRPLRVMEAAGSAEFHRERTTWEDGAAVVLRLSALPALLGQSLEVAAELASAFSGDATAHVAQGVVRVRIPELPETMASELVESVLRVRSRLEEFGGGVTVSTASGSVARLLSPQGGTGNEEVVSERIKKLFDPLGVLAPRCL